MSDLDSQVINGAEARYILDSPVFKKALSSIRDSIISQMEQVKARDKEMHSELIRRLQTADAVTKALRETIRTGELAEIEIKHQKTLAQRARDMGMRVFSRN